MKGVCAMVLSCVFLLGTMAPVDAGGGQGRHAGRGGWTKSGQSAPGIRSGFERAARLAHRLPHRPPHALGQQHRSLHGFSGRRIHGFRHDHRAFRPHHRFRTRTVVGATVFLGSPVWVGPRWWPAYVAPPAVVYQTPQVYVAAPPPPTYWYYCEDPAGYYPYVQECRGGWRTIVPPATPPAE